jgi:hypothetical protein
MQETTSDEKAEELSPPEKKIPDPVIPTLPPSRLRVAGEFHPLPRSLQPKVSFASPQPLFGQPSVQYQNPFTKWDSKGVEPPQPVMLDHEPGEFLQRVLNMRPQQTSFQKPAKKAVCPDSALLGFRIGLGVGLLAIGGYFAWQWFSSPTKQEIQKAPPAPDLTLEVE